MNEALITLVDGQKVFRRSVVLTFPKIVLRHGTFLGIYGENASGKSTLLRILARITAPSSGTLVWAGSLSNKRMVFVPQSGGLYMNLTARENFHLFARLYDCAPGSAKPIFEALGLGRAENQPVHTLSGGYQKLAAIACALSVDPHGIFVDEPFSGLDREHTAIVIEQFTVLRNRLEFLVGTDHGNRDVGLFSTELNLTKRVSQ